MTKPVHIVELRAENVKRLRAVKIRPEGPLVVVGGKNGQGKSSAIDSIEYALGGRAALPAVPIRRGEDWAEVELVLSNGLRVVHRTETGKAPKLTVTADGIRQGSPQTILDGLYGSIAFDPLEYTRMDPKKQAAILRELAGVDTTAIDAERAELFERRTEKNREVKRLDARLNAMPHHPSAPAEEVDVGDIADELARMAAIATENAAKRREAEEAGRVMDEAERALSDAQADVIRIERELAAARDRVEFRTRARDSRIAVATELALAASRLTDPDPSAAQARVREAEGTNRQVRENREREAVRLEHQAVDAAADKLSARIAEIDGRKARELAGAKFPVEGLGLGEDGTVTFRGLPLDQASGAERLRVSVAIGLALNPKLRVLLVRDGSLLDSSALAIVAEMAAEADAQIWLERVSEDGAGCSVVIEDGAVVGNGVAVTTPAAATAGDSQGEEDFV